MTCMCQSLTWWPEMRGCTGCASSSALSAVDRLGVAAGRAVLEHLAQLLGAPAQHGEVPLGGLVGLPARRPEERPDLVQRLHLGIYKIDGGPGVLVEVHPSKVVGRRCRGESGHGQVDASHGRPSATPDRRNRTNLGRMLRSVILAAARSPRVERLVETAPVSRDVVRRFVAGTGTDDAIRVDRATSSPTGSRVSIDHLGEDTRHARAGRGDPGRVRPAARARWPPPG